jgi:ribosomal-protein-alanine N-acetyltransferase
MTTHQRKATAPQVLPRPMKEEEANAAEQLLSESPQAAQWAARDLRHFLRGEVEIWVAASEGVIEGLVASRRVADEGEILNLAVSAGRRRRSLGTILLNDAIARLRVAGVKSVFLEVRESNTRARAFYRKAGFSETYRRPRYYKNPDEDAVVMTRSASETSQ